VGSRTHGRATLVSAKVAKAIRSNAPAYGFPAILANTGQRTNSLRSDMCAADPALSAFLGVA